MSVASLSASEALQTTIPEDDHADSSVDPDPTRRRRSRSRRLPARSLSSAATLLSPRCLRTGAWDRPREPGLRLDGVDELSLPRHARLRSPTARSFRPLRLSRALCGGAALSLPQFSGPPGSAA